MSKKKEKWWVELLNILFSCCIMLGNFGLLSFISIIWYEVLINNIKGIGVITLLWLVCVLNVSIFSYGYYKTFEKEDKK